MKTLSTKHTLKQALLKTTLILTSALTVATNTALAHPGHGVDHDHPWSVWHYLGSPRHSLVIVAGLVVVGAIVVGIRTFRRNARNDEQE